jgi:hypothetical protein
MFAFNYTADLPWRLLVVGGAATAVALGRRRNSNEINWQRLTPMTATALGLATSMALLYLNASTRFLYFQF